MVLTLGMASTQLIHTFEEESIKCQFCKIEFMYILYDWYYHSKNQVECVDCHGESEYPDDELICKDCWQNAFQVCECGEIEPPKIDESKLSINECEYCQKFLGLIIGGYPDSTLCKTCDIDYEKDCKMRIVCPDCRNNLN